MSGMKKTGLLFGSFNPIHIGHLIIASYMLEFSDLEELWFVVSPQNPLKERSSLLADHHRMMMVNIAIEDDYRFRSSNIEFDLPRPSYTIHTLTYSRNDTLTGVCAGYRHRHFSRPSTNGKTGNSWNSISSMLIRVREAKTMNCPASFCHIV
jgi:cytidyltransferase-like protein